jgi:hypothetical protein
MVPLCPTQTGKKGAGGIKKLKPVSAKNCA